LSDELKQGTIGQHNRSHQFGDSEWKG
jgi:hypothetical protein